MRNDGQHTGTGRDEEEPAIPRGGARRENEGAEGHKEEGQKKGRTSESVTHRVRSKGDHKTCTGATHHRAHFVRDERGNKLRGRGQPSR